MLRNAIVWHKPYAMPESIRDRMNCRHEMIFLLVKQPSYWPTMAEGLTMRSKSLPLM
jgi:hypothetical protein